MMVSVVVGGQDSLGLKNTYHHDGKCGGVQFSDSKTLTTMMVSVVVSNSPTQKHLPHGG